LFKTTDADVVALQEADGPSFWSGNFDHVEYLANQASFGHSVHAAHVDGIGLSYGTALLANLELQNAQAITFDPGLSPIPKGFVVSTIRWPGTPCVEIDVVSTHLDFASDSVRRKQTTELIEALRTRNRPLIIMGDLNSEWELQNSSVQYLSQELSLTAYSPERTDLATFPAFGERLDWILVSPELEFRSYRVLADVVSDHRGVVADLVLDNATRASTVQDSCSLAKAEP
jgi:endonuclease/exonuclease/phosphatase family metal-dependent hydrolase